VATGFARVRTAPIAIPAKSGNLFARRHKFPVTAGSFFSGVKFRRPRLA
ncbi:uncharacterized protein METZ01_LOCUS229793, partial [marine metagenome]